MCICIYIYSMVWGICNQCIYTMGRILLNDTNSYIYIYIYSSAHYASTHIPMLYIIAHLLQTPPISYGTTPIPNIYIYTYIYSYRFPSRSPPRSSTCPVTPRC